MQQHHHKGSSPESGSTPEGCIQENASGISLHARACKRMPAEWEPQEAVWLSWPLNEKTWPSHREAVNQRFAELAALLSRYVKVYINCVASEEKRIRLLLNASAADLNQVTIFDIPTNDAWCRDHGPTFISSSKPGADTVSGNAPVLSVVNWRYNAWGGKFAPWDLDDAVPAKIASKRGCPCLSSSLFCEGGAIDPNGQGLLLTTRSVLLNPNRNPERSMAEVEQELTACLGVRTVIWLEGGMETDDTDGHIDTIARFTSADTVLCIDPSDTRHLNEENKRLERNLQTLRDWSNPCPNVPTQRLQIDILPRPSPCYSSRNSTELLPASYANFLITNNMVIVPSYNQPETDQKAAGIIASHFPNRDIVCFPSMEFLEEGGAVHCLTQQQPLV